MKPQRSYSDPEIACYVLGLDLPDQAEGIQALLARDDAAAARALKWEAYLLGIVDALPATRPPDEILERIQQTLGMTFEPAAPAPVLGESRDRPRPFAERTRQAPWPDWLHHPAWPHGLSTLRGANRARRHRDVEPCPPEKREAIEEALRHFGVI